MVNLPGSEPGQGNRLPARGRNTREGTKGRAKHDSAIGVPRTTAVRKAIGQYLRGAASDVDSLELACCGESNRAVVRGPERIVGTFGSRQRLRIGFIQG